MALVDLKLPDMDGVEVIDRLAALSQLTQTIVLTGNAQHRERAARAAATHLRLPGQAGAAGEAADDDRSRRRALAAPPRRRGAAAERGAGAAPPRAHLRRRHGRRRRARHPLRQPVGPPPARLPAERAARPALPRRRAPGGRGRDRDVPPRRAPPRRRRCRHTSCGCGRATATGGCSRSASTSLAGRTDIGRRPADRPRRHRAPAHGTGAAAGAADGQHRPARRRRRARLQQHPHRHPRLLGDPARRRAAGQRLAARPRGDPEGGAARRLAQPPAAGLQPAADARPEGPRSRRGRARLRAHDRRACSASTSGGARTPTPISGTCRPIAASSNRC